MLQVPDSDPGLGEGDRLGFLIEKYVDRKINLGPKPS